MTTQTTIQPIGYSTDSTQTKSTTATKSSFGDTLSMLGSSFAYPASVAVSDSSTSTQAITAAAVNGVSGVGYLASSGSRSYGMDLGYSSAGMYGLGSSLEYSGTTTGSSTTADVSAMLSQSAVSQAEMIALQAQMGNQSVQTNAISNVLNMKNMMELSVIRNMKTS